MKCPICQITWEDAKGVRCPQCAFDASSPDAKDPVKVLAAREAFKTKVSGYAPESRVSRWDLVKPWLAVILGFAIFLLWLKACGSVGSQLMRYRRHSYSRYNR